MKKASPKKVLPKMSSKKVQKKMSPKKPKKVSPKKKVQKVSPKKKVQKVSPKKGGGSFNKNIAKKIVTQDKNKENLLDLCDKLFKNTEFEEQYTKMKTRKDKDPKVAEYEVINLCKNSALSTLGQKSPVQAKKFNYPSQKPWWKFW